MHSLLKHRFLLGVAASALSLAACVDGDTEPRTVVTEEEPMPASASDEGTADEGSTSPAAATVTDASAADRFLGTYTFVGGDVERKALEKAIDGVVMKMSIFARGIARDRLTETNQIPQTVEIVKDGQHLAVKVQGRENKAPLDGTAVKIKASTGDDMMLSFKVGERLVQHAKGDDKGKVTTYTVDGNRMTMKSRIYASQLPQDLEYTLTYEKK